MFSIGPRKNVLVTPSKRTVTVGDNSYLSLRGDGSDPPPRVILTRGRENGHLLLIESALGHPFIMVDNPTANRTELGGSKTMTGADELLLVWSGTRWVQVSFSKNH